MRLTEWSRASVEIDCVSDRIDRAVHGAWREANSHIRFANRNRELVLQQYRDLPGVGSLTRKTSSRKVSEECPVAFPAIERIHLQAQSEREPDLDHRAN